MVFTDYTWWMSALVVFTDNTEDNGCSQTTLGIVVVHRQH